jgi:hypothetical protein
MSTTRSFSAMLNEYLPNSLLSEELIQRDYLLTKVEKDNTWLGGDLIVPFEGAGASSIQFGSLTASTDVAEDVFVRGKLTTQPELWGTMVFNEKDLIQHGKLSDQNLLKILPNRVEKFMEYMKMAVSVNILGGPHLAKATGNGAVGGTLAVDKIDRFQIGQKITLVDGDTAQADYYVTAINVNTSVITVSATRGGAVADISAYTLAQNAKVYHPGVLVAGVATNNFTSLRSALLSLANGGSTNLYGQSKLAYPYLQAVNIDGSTVTSSNVLASIFDGYSTVRQKAKGNANTVLMSYKWLGNCMKLIEVSKGAYKVTPDSMKANLYGWTEIEVTSVKGTLTLVGIQEMDDDIIMYMDWNALKFYSNGFFRKRSNPETGEEYFVVRNTTGYQYLVDIALFGDLVLEKPGHCAIMYGIP